MTYLNGLLYLFLVFFGWLVAPDLSLLVLGFLLALVFQRRGIVVLRTMIAASTNLLVKFVTHPRVLALVPATMVTHWLATGHATWTIMPSDVELKHRAEFGAVGLMFVWLTVVVMWISGFQSLQQDIAQGPERFRLGLKRFAFACACGVALAATAGLYLGPFGVVGMIEAVGLFGVVYYFALRDIARYRWRHAPEAGDTSRLRGAANAAVLFVSDAHLTADGRNQTSGDPSGIRNLDLLTTRLRQDIEPAWLVLPGDLVETGRPEEWNVAIPMLQRLRKRGIRILLAPGNHDVAVSYQHLRALAFLSNLWPQQGFRDATRMASYIEMAAALERRLLTADGQRLEDFWDRELARASRLVKRWQAAIEAAASQLEKVAPFRWAIRQMIRIRPPIALYILQAFDRSAANKLITPLVDEAIAILEASNARAAFLSREFWYRVFTQSSACQLHPSLLDAKWKLLWHDLFPLELVDRDRGLEFIIVNSNIPEVGLFGSAAGQLTEDQTTRLVTRVSTSSQPVVIILMHHPICRWRDDPPGRFRININRWAFLAHDSTESERLPGLLRAAAPASCRQIIICGGHVHDIARAGELQVGRGKSESERLDRLLILENPALPNVTRPVSKASHPNSRDLLICERTDDGTLAPARVHWRDFFERVETINVRPPTYATASGNDYVQHETTYRQFLRVIWWSVALIAAILALLALALV